MTRADRKIIDLLFAGIAFAFLLHLFYAITLSPVFGDDAFIHLGWLEEFVRLRSEGINFPRWLSSTYGGIGSPTFYFYPPLVYFIGDLFFSLGALRSPTALFHAVNASSLILSAFTFYWYARTRGLNRQYSVLAALLYAAASYRYVDVYTRAALGEHVAFAWIPLVFLSIDQASRSTSVSQRLSSLVTAAMGWSLLILTNIPSTVVTAVLVIPYGLLLFRKQLLLLWPALAGALLAVAICAFTILPLIAFKGLIKTEELYNFDIFSSQWHHVLIELFEPGPRKSAIHLSALASAGIAVVLVWMLVRHHRDKLSAQLLSLLSIAGVCIFFQLPYISDVIWDNFELLQLLQFSWRFTIGVVFFTAIAIPLLLQRNTKPGISVLSVTVVVSLFFYLRFGYLLLTYPIPEDILEPVRKGAPEYVNRYMTLPKAELRLWAIEIMHEAAFFARMATIEHRASFGDTVRASITAQKHFDLEIRRMWWPQWRLEYASSGSGSYQQAELSPSSEGLMVAHNLPAGKLDVRLMIVKSEVEKRGELISLVGVAIFVTLCCVGIAGEMRSKSRV